MLFIYLYRSEWPVLWSFIKMYHHNIICFLSSLVWRLPMKNIGPKLALRGKGVKSASYPDVSLLMKMCVQRKAGRRQRAKPSVCTLPMVPCGSWPVIRVSRLPLPCEKRSAWGGGWCEVIYIPWRTCRCHITGDRWK